MELERERIDHRYNSVILNGGEEGGFCEVLVSFVWLDNVIDIVHAFWCAVFRSWVVLRLFIALWLHELSRTCFNWIKINVNKIHHSPAGAAWQTQNYFSSLLCKDKVTRHAGWADTACCVQGTMVKLGAQIRDTLFLGVLRATVFTSFRFNKYVCQ